MFGCGKLNELDVLYYLEKQWSKIDRDNIELHIQECTLCLGEITELSRVNAVMDSKEKVVFEKPKSVSLFYKYNELVRWFGSGVVLKPVAAVATRSQSATGKYDAEITIQGAHIQLRVLAQESGDYWISIRGEALRNATLEIQDKESGKTIFARRADQDEALVKGLPAGAYKIKLNDEYYHVNINIEKAEQAE